MKDRTLACRGQEVPLARRLTPETAADDAFSLQDTTGLVRPWRNTFQMIRSFPNRSPDVLQNLSDHGNLGLRFAPFFLVHVFVYGGDGLCPVTGIGAGRISPMRVSRIVLIVG